MVEAYLTKGWFDSVIKRWRKKHKVKIAVEASSSCELLEYHFIDKEGEEIAV
jgi:ribonuclease G